MAGQEIKDYLKLPHTQLDIQDPDPDIEEEDTLCRRIENFNWPSLLHEMEEHCLLIHSVLSGAIDQHQGQLDMGVLYQQSSF